MTSLYIAQITLFAGNFAPSNTMMCNGQLLSIAQNTALFALVGTTYGGNGTTTFAIPDLRGRAPIGTGTGPGLSTIQLGQAAGVEQTTLLSNQMPQHTHTGTLTNGGLPFVNSAATSATPATGSALGIASGEDADLNNVAVRVYVPSAGVSQSVAIGTAGSNSPVDIRNPYLGLNYIMTTQGIFPSRN
jgi:microcystin-dependent protein